MRDNGRRFPKAASWLAGIVLAAAAATALTGCDDHERGMHYDSYYEEVTPYRSAPVVVVHRPVYRRPPRIARWPGRGHGRHDGRGHR